MHLSSLPPVCNFIHTGQLTGSQSSFIVVLLCVGAIRRLLINTQAQAHKQHTLGQLLRKGQCPRMKQVAQMDNAASWHTLPRMDSLNSWVLNEACFFFSPTSQINCNYKGKIDCQGANCDCTVTIITERRQRKFLTDRQGTRKEVFCAGKDKVPVDNPLQEKS